MMQLVCCQNGDTLAKEPLPQARVMQLYILVDHYYVLSLPELCPNVEKKYLYLNI